MTKTSFRLFKVLRGWAEAKNIAWAIRYVRVKQIKQTLRKSNAYKKGHWLNA